MMFDTTTFKAIVNPPNAAILLVMGGMRTIVLGEMVEGINIKIMTRMVMMEQLSTNLASDGWGYYYVNYIDNEELFESAQTTDFVKA